MINLSKTHQHKKEHPPFVSMKVCARITTIVFIMEEEKLPVPVEKNMRERIANIVVPKFRPLPAI
jgi:hypothetical protein